MGRGIKAKLPKKKGEKYTFTKKQLNEFCRQHAREILKGTRLLLEYNMILENHLTPEEAKRQGELMDIRAEAILDGNLTWREIEQFLDEYYEKADGGNDAN